MTRDLQSPGAGQLTTVHGEGSVEETQSAVQSVLTGVTLLILTMKNPTES